MSETVPATNAARLRAAMLFLTALAMIPALPTPGSANTDQDPFEISISKPGGDVRLAASGLTLENARPMAVPPLPGLKIPPSIAKPQRLTLPQPLSAPPAPDLTTAFPTAPEPPPSPEGAPPIPAPTATVTAPTIAPAPPPAPEPVPQVATIPPTAPAPDASVPDKAEVTALPPIGPRSIRFDGHAADLGSEEEALVARIADRMRGVTAMRLQLRSYASGTDEEAREARQLSLARALALRDRLSALGVRSTRVDVRAMGIDTQGNGAADRIDIEPQNE